MRALPASPASPSHARRRRRRMRTRTMLLVAVAVGAGISLDAASAATIPRQEGASSSSAAQAASLMRWGAAAAQLDGLLLIHGGKASANAGLTYASAPESSDLLLLNLTTSFPLTDPPWQTLTTPATAAFHTLSPFTRAGFLLFGGQSNTAPTPSGNDSLYIFNLTDTLSPTFASAASTRPGWEQPMRRMWASAPSDPVAQSLYLLGGEKADGSGILLQELWTLSSQTNVFSQVLPAPPTNIVDGAVPLLADGTVVLLGGLNASAQLAPLDSITAYQPGSNTWTTTATASSTGAYPPPRRAHIAVPLPGNRVFLHGGAGAADLSSPLADAWILDWSKTIPVWSPLASNANSAGTTATATGPSARYAHNAVSYGNKVLLAYGWTGYNAADTALWVWDGTQASVDPGSGAVVGGVWLGGGAGAGAGEGTSSGGPVGAVPSYTPDPDAQPQSNGLGWSSAASGGNHATSPGTSSGTHHGAGTGTGASAGDGSAAPSSTPTDGTQTKGTDGGAPEAGTKAGIILGALMGLGLAAGAGYYAYRAYQNYHHPYGGAGAGARGGGGGGGPTYGKAALLGHHGSGSGYGYGYEDEGDGYTRPAGGAGAAAAAAAASAAAAVGGFLSSSLASRKRRRDEYDGVGSGAGGGGGGGVKHGFGGYGYGGTGGERVMLEKGHYSRLGGGGGGWDDGFEEDDELHDMRNYAPPSPTGADLGSPMPPRSGAGRIHAPVGPRGPRDVHNHRGTAARGLDRLQERSDGSMGGRLEEIPMAGSGFVGGVLTAQHTGGRTGGVRDKLARLVGVAAGRDGADGGAGGAGVGVGFLSSGHGGIGASGRSGGAMMPRRLDILADEDADEEALRRKYPRQFGGSAGVGVGASRRRAGVVVDDPFADSLGIDGEEEMDEVGMANIQAPRHGSAGRYAEPEYRQRDDEDNADGYLVSPFEDQPASRSRPMAVHRQPTLGVRPIVNFRGSTLAAEHADAGRDSLESATRRQPVHHTQQPALFSNILNASTSASGGMAVAWADGGGGAEGGEGGAADVGAGEGEDGTARSPLMRRSATWWDRFMATSFLDRSSSGALGKRTTMAPTAVDPIRDPRKLNESITSMGSLVENAAGEHADPFGDGHGVAVDEQGRRAKMVPVASTDGQGEMTAETPASLSSAIIQPHGGKHTRSLSSLQSARTATSSVLEARLAGMDVVQRTHTLSSSRGAPSSVGASEDGTASVASTPLSRGPSLLDQHRRGPDANLGRVTEDDPFGADRRDGNPWNGRFDDGDEANTSAGPDNSADIVEQRQHEKTERQGRAEEDNPFGVQLRPSPLKHLKTDLKRSPSEAPSITPSLTKRSRQNRQLTTPVSPLLTHTPPAPIVGSVRERVEALERKYTGDEASLPTSSTPPSVRSGQSGAGGDTSATAGGDWLGMLAFNSAHAGTPTSERTTAAPDSLYTYAYAPTASTGGTSTAPASASSHGEPPLSKKAGAGAGAVTTSTRVRTRTRSRSNSPTRPHSRPVSTSTPTKLGAGKPPSVSSAATSGASGTGTAGRQRITVGLVPKAQLFVANPDREGSM